jgi:putative DNA primase/helicase
MSTEHSQQETAVTYAAWLKERFEAKGILREIAGYPNFVVWHYKEADGQRKKPPVNPNTLHPASPTDRSTWGTLESTLSVVATGTYQGIGFMLSHSPFSGIDLDHCIQEGSMQPWAQEIIETMDTSTEYSPSWNRATGTGGVHLFVEGKPPASKKAGNIEVYGEKHYLTITTKHLPRTPATVNSRQAELDALHASLVPAPTHLHEYQNTGGGALALPRTELPPEAERDAVLQRLLRGDISGYTSQSSADFVLVMKLLHWTGDNIALTKQLFRESGLYRQKSERKTGETTYLDMTINNALRKRRNPPMRR